MNIPPMSEIIELTTRMRASVSRHKRVPRGPFSECSRMHRLIFIGGIRSAVFPQRTAAAQTRLFHERSNGVLRRFDSVALTTV